MCIICIMTPVYGIIVWYPSKNIKPGNSGAGTEPIATGLRNIPPLSMPLMTNPIVILSNPNPHALS